MKVDTTIIKDITFSMPEFMSANAKEEYIKLYNSKKEIENQIWQCRQQIFDLEKKSVEIGDKLSALNKCIDNIEFEQRDIQEIKNECNLGINNKSDGRNIKL